MSDKKKLPKVCKRLSALGAGLYSLGVPENSVLEYESGVKAGKFLVLAHGTPAELAKVQKVCGNCSTNYEAKEALQGTA